MRFFTLLCLYFACWIPGYAQIVSLSNKEIATLKTLNKKDTSSSRVLQLSKEQAEQYLNETPAPMDTIRTEGLLKGNPKKVKSWQAFKDFEKTYTLALQYRLSGDKPFLEKAIAFLSAWAKVNRPNGNPIDDTNLDKAVEAYDLIKNQMPPSERTAITKWLSETAWAEVNSKRMKPGRATANNNWNAHRLKVVGEIAYAISDQELIKWTLENLQSHIAVNLYADGTSLDFKERDAMHYHIYDLDPLLKLAIIIHRGSGQNYYRYESPRSSSVKKSVEWLLPYVEGKEQHEEYVHTTVQFDRDRAKNNEPGFAAGTMFEPKMALPVLELSVYFDQRQLPMLNQFKKSASLQSVVDRVKRTSANIK